VRGRDACIFPRKCVTYPLDQHDALCPRRISAVEHAQQKALVRPCVALTVLGVDFPHDLDEAPQTSPR